MATQFMSPSSYMAVPPATGYQGYSNGKMGGFSFRKRVERVDWRKISMVDIDNISRTLDFSTLQENIMNITFCNLEAELDIRTVDPNFVKLFKLAQLTIEYLLHSQEFLATLCTTLEDKIKQSDQEIEKTKQEVEVLQKELSEVKKESHKRKKMLIAQQQLLHVGNESYNKCPFCAKSFINNSYLQSHIVRRHSTSNGSKDGSSSVSPDLGVGSESVRNNLEAEILHIKERLLKYEVEHQEEKQVVMSHNKTKEEKIIAKQVNHNSSVLVENVEEGEKIGMSAALMKEVRELNAKYQASQKALRELEARTGGKRSYLGDMEEDIENEKELLKEQRSEVAAFKEQLQQQLDLMKNHMETKLSKQETKWQKKVQQMTQEHASEIKKLNNALETTSRSQEEYHNPKHSKQQQEVQEILRQSREREKELKVQEQHLEKEMIRSAAVKSHMSATTAQGEIPKGSTPTGGPDKTSIPPGIRHSQMYPSDDEGTTGFGTGTSSLRTFHSGTPRSTLGQTGTQSLHTLQFLEELRKNPTLALMRDQLAELLQEQAEKKGIPPNQTGITDEVLKSKLAILSTQRQMHVQKHPDFNERREYFNKKATDEARKQLKMQSQPPHGVRRRLDLLQHTSNNPSPTSGLRSGPPHPQQHLSAQRTTPVSTGSRGFQRTTAVSTGSRGFSPELRPQPQPRATTPRNAKVALSTGSTTEWTNTHFGSDDDSIEDDVAGGKASVPTGARLIQSGPARGPGGPTPSPRSQGPKTRLIQSKPLNNTVDDFNYDRADRKSFSVPSSPKRAGAFADKINAIEKKLEGRETNDKPFAGVDVGAAVGVNKSKGNGVRVGDSDVDNDWDDDTEPDEPAPAVAKRHMGRGSTDASNTYGSSAWGSSSKAASTIKDKDRRSTSRSSFVSVTDVSSDDDGI